MVKQYIVNKKFPFGLEKMMLSQEQIKMKSLIFIGTIKAKDIVQDSEQLNKLVNEVEARCKNKRLWGLFGSDNLKEWLPLQLASVSAKNSDIRSEIKADLKRMTPFDNNKDVRSWKSIFYGPIMEVENGLDIVCQKYSKLREICSYFAIAILEKEDYEDDYQGFITKYQKKEIDLAYELKPLIWNPSPKEKKYIQRKKLKL